MKDLELDMQKAKENETAYLYSYLINLNGEGHPADLDMEINIIQSAMYNILKEQDRTRGWPNAARWLAKNSLSTFLNGGKYFGRHRHH